MNESATARQKEAFESWFLAQLMKGKMVWMHAVYRAILPDALYDKAASGEGLLKAREYAKAQGYTVHEFRGDNPQHPGLTEIRKAGLTVAIFEPKLVGAYEEAHLEFNATILGKPIDILALIRGTSLEL